MACPSNAFCIISSGDVIKAHCTEWNWANEQSIIYPISQLKITFFHPFVFLFQHSLWSHKEHCYLTLKPLLGCDNTSWLVLLLLSVFPRSLRHSVCVCRGLYAAGKMWCFLGIYRSYVISDDTGSAPLPSGNGKNKTKKLQYCRSFEYFIHPSLS